HLPPAVVYDYGPAYPPPVVVLPPPVMAAPVMAGPVVGPVVAPVVGPPFPAPMPGVLPGVPPGVMPGVMPGPMLSPEPAAWPPAGYATGPLPPDPEGTPGCLVVREYTTEIEVGGRPVEGYGYACLQADGSWKRGAPAPAR
ncbi:MAG: hypothetical protein R3322_23765, partial [Kiloniellales bacterium]|nr:hypothetical protein [Kiloniellales bacterium]